MHYFLTVLKQQWFQYCFSIDFKTDISMNCYRAFKNVVCSGVPVLQVIGIILIIRLGFGFFFSIHHVSSSTVTCASTSLSSIFN